jgi:tRNA pseudouridine55 synthase
VYEATLELGRTSTTGDPEGELTDVSGVVPAVTDIVGSLEIFTGDIMQTPPIFSAIKIDGQRAYKHARAGREIVMQPRPVTIFSLELLEYAYPSVTIRTHVSSGTYIRSLAEDIGKMLGTGAYLTALRRTKIADFDVAESVPLEKFMAL